MLAEIAAALTLATAPTPEPPVRVDPQLSWATTAEVRCYQPGAWTEALRKIGLGDRPLEPYAFTFPGSGTIYMQERMCRSALRGGAGLFILAHERAHAVDGIVNEHEADRRAWHTLGWLGAQLGWTQKQLRFLRHYLRLIHPELVPTS